MVGEADRHHGRRCRKIWQKTDIRLFVPTCRVLEKVASRTNRGILTGMLISSRNSCMQSILTAFFCAAIRLAADWRAIRGKVPAPRQNACVVRCRGNPQGAAEFSSAHCKISRAWKNLLLSIPVVGPLLLKPLQKFIYKLPAQTTITAPLR